MENLVNDNLVRQSRDKILESCTPKNLIDEIFLKTQNGSFTNIIKNQGHILNLLEYLYICPNESDKLEIINYLGFNFKQVPHNMDIFLKVFIVPDKNNIFVKNLKKLNLFHILIDSYILSDSIIMESSIKECLEELVNNVECKKEIIEAVYQKMSVYYRIPLEEKQSLEKSLFIKFLQLLKIFYGEKLNIVPPNNFFYFSGNGYIGVKKLEEEKISLKHGLTISLWFRLELNEVCDLNHFCDLLILKCTKDQKIQISLFANKLVINNTETGNTHKFNKEWNHMTIKLSLKRLNKPNEIVIILNDKIITHPTPSLNTEVEITDILFFQNFIGQATSILFFAKEIHEKYITTLKDFSSYGIYNEKKLFRFIKSGYPKYMTNSNFEKNDANIKINNNNIDGFVELIDNLKFFYTPFRAYEKTIYDLTNKYNGYINTYDNLNGIHNFNSLQKNIFFLGGINNTLPIVELMFTNIHILDSETFLELLELIYIILNYRKKNMKDAVNKHFFHIFSLFLEKFPNEIFTSKICEMFLNIGKSLFAFVDECELASIYFDNILLNEKIFTKFDLNLQCDLWSSLYQFYVSDELQIKSFMRMFKICLVLRYYDSTRFTEFCCEEHASLFEPSENVNNKIVIMNPPLKVKIENLINIIKLILEFTDQSNSEENVTQLFKLLAFDISPCLQKMIIRIFISYFSSNKVPEEKKRDILKKMFKKNCFEIIIYSYSLALIDVRCEYIKLLKEITSNNLRDIIVKERIYEDKLVSFIKEYVLPTNLLTTKGKVNNIEPSVRERSNVIHGHVTKRNMTLTPNAIANDREFHRNSNKFSKTAKNNDKPLICYTEKNAEGDDNYPFDAPEEEHINIVEKEEEEHADGESLTNFYDSLVNVNINKPSKVVEVKNNNTKDELIALESLEAEDNYNINKTTSVLVSPSDVKSNPIVNIKPKKSKNLFLSLEDDPITNSSISNKSNKVAFTTDDATSCSFKKDRDLAVNTDNFDKPELNPFIKKEIKSLKSKSIEYERVITGDNETKSRFSLKKNVKGFSNLRNSFTEKRSVNLDKIKIDIEGINKIYKYGGEKVEVNLTEEEESKELETRIREIAKHCVDFINGEPIEDCSKFSSDMSYIYTDKNIKPISTAISSKVSEIDITNEDIIEGDTKIIFAPRSTRGEKKISFNKFCALDDVIEEEAANSEMNSPFKTKRKSSAEANNNGTNSNDKLSNVKLKLNFDNDYIKTEPCATETNEVNYTLSPDPNERIEYLSIPHYKKPAPAHHKFMSANYISSLGVEAETELMSKYYNKEKYKKYVDILYNNCFEWLLNKKETNSHLYLDDNDNIVNPPVIDIIIKLALNSEIHFIQRLMQEFHLILINNKENCLTMFKNTYFYTWLLETCFKFYQTKSNDSTAFSIYELGKKIHTNLIINTIKREENLRSEPMNKINDLLSWGIYYKNIFDYSKKICCEINDFIKSFLKDIINVFKEKLQNLSPNVNLSIWENFISFSILCYEYMTFYNLEKNLKDNFLSMSESNFQGIIVPRNIFTGLNLENHSENYEKNENKVKINLSDIWTDYKLFESIYTCFSRIWRKSPFMNNSQLNLNDINQSSRNLIHNYEKVIEEYITEKKNREIFMEDLRILTFYYKSNYSNHFNNYDIPLIKVLSNLMTITITLVNEESEIKLWLEEYEHFLTFLIIASTNTIREGYLIAQDLCIDVISFGLCFLLDEYHNSRQNSPVINKYFLICIKNVFTLICLIMDTIYKINEKKKKRNLNNIISGLMKKKGKIDLTKSAVYRLFSEFVLDSNNQPLLSQKVVTEMKLSNFKDIPEIFKKPSWIKGLNQSSILKNRLKFLFDFTVYDNIMKERNDRFKKHIPFYNLTQPKPNNDTNHGTVYNKVLTIKNNLNKRIEEIVGIWELSSKEYNNSSFSANKNRKVVYKIIKKKLFSWRGMWSDRDMFYNNIDKIKVKILNHYTKEFSRPLLIPVLDVNHYIPKFSKYDINQLFHPNEKNSNYKLDLDIDKILSQEPDNCQSISNESKDDAQNFNFIRDVYKYNSTSIWNRYQEINSKVDISKTAQYDDMHLSGFKLNSSDPKYRSKEFIFECCFVKPSHHIKGIFIINNDYFSFRVYLNQIQATNVTDSLININPNILSQNLNQTNYSYAKVNHFEVIDKDEDFDVDRNTCYGSYFVSHHKNKLHLNYSFHYSEIKYLFKKKILL